MLIERDGDITRRTKFQDGKVYNETSQDITAILDHNAFLRSERSGTDRFKKALVAKHLMHAMTVPTTFVTKMRNGQCCTDGKVYDMWSTDREERKLAMLHVQCCHKEFMTVSGKPLGNKIAWR